MERLAKEGLNVVVPVRKESNREYLPHESVEIQDADLLDPQSVKSLLKGIDRVFHLASIRGSGWSFCDEKVYRVNVGMTQNLLEASLREGVRQFVYISSVSVYGHPCGGPIDEDYPCSPKTRYGMTKHRSETLVREFHEREKLPMTIVRPVITYGPRDSEGMVQKLCSLINSRRYLTVGNGENRIHLIYIDDLIEGLMLAINHRLA